MTEDTTLTIKNLCLEAYTTSASKGWHEQPLAQKPAKRVGHHIGCTVTLTEEPPSGIDYNAVSAKLALIHSEVSEALECVRDNDFMLHVSEYGKPEGFTVELADAVIRIGDLVTALGLTEDFVRAIMVKMAYNKTRPHRHGGREL